MKKLCLLLSAVFMMFSCSTNNNGTVTVVPLAPTNLTGSAFSTTQVNLSWTDNATNEDGYKIERKTGTGNYAVIGSMGANLSNYSDLGLTPNTSYTYRVYAYNSAGNSLEYSNEVTVTTQDTTPSWLTNGLVAYYPFNGNANDESGNGNNGTVNGATLAADRFGNASQSYSFNGINNWITVPSAPSLNLIGSFSISSWLNASIFNSHNVIVSKNHGVTGQGTWHFIIEQNANLYQLHYNADPCFCLATMAGNGSNVPTNQWTHVLASYDSASNLLKYYMNGNLISSFNNFTYNNQITNFDFLIGKETGLNGTITGYFNGSLDDIRIYNRALSASEVAYLAAH